MKTIKPTHRRKFLMAAGLGTAGVAAAVTVGRQPQVKAAAETPADKPSGYHVSDHILKYYKTTEV